MMRGGKVTTMGERFRELSHSSEVFAEVGKEPVFGRV